MRRWLRVLFVGVLALLVSIDSASACRFLRNRCRPRCRTVACVRPLPACSPCAAPDEIISIATPQCCVPADGSAHAEIVAPATEGVVESVTESTPAVEAPVKDLTVPAPVAAEKPAPAPLTPVPVAPASAEQPVPAPQFKTAKEILEESAAKEAAEKAAVEAKAIADAKAAAEAKAAEEVLAEEEAAEPAAEEEPTEEEKPAAEEAPEEEPATEEPAEEPAPKEATEEEPAEEEEENLFDETDGDADEKTKPAAEDPADEPAQEETEEKTEEPKAEDDPFAGILRVPSEPVRRWIDNTGVHETIGRLVEVHADHIRILKSNGRHATVPFTRLSRHDQDYVTTTGARIAAEQRSQPAVHDTAGL